MKALSGTATIASIFDNLEDFETMLAQARMNADSTWEEEFAENMELIYETRGDAMIISESQLNQLKRIALWED